MVRDQHLNTRVTPEAYQALLRKCADQGCTPYKYIRQLVHADVGLDIHGDVPEETDVEADALVVPDDEEPVSEEVKEDGNNIEKRYKIVG